MFCFVIFTYTQEGRKGCQIWKWVFEVGREFFICSPLTYLNFLPYASMNFIIKNKIRLKKILKSPDMYMKCELNVDYLGGIIFSIEPIFPYFQTNVKF